MLDTKPSFNLWYDPWIGLEKPGGGIDRLGIEQALLHAGDYCTLYDTSPLVVIGIHRLLAAVLQSSLNPQSKEDLKRLWSQPSFPTEPIQAFGTQYAERFDLFSETAPFLQSADAPLKPAKNDPIKTSAYLIPDFPSGTAVTHYRHGTEDSQYLCPACLAAGLVTIPAFATSGGSGIKPSINGVPPIYVMPGGESLFECLLASLLLPEFQPSLATDPDQAWWLRDPQVPRSTEVNRVGYLHSLTFPARRVRLHPKHGMAHCTRCGETAEWGAADMLFEMGESRPKDAAFWFDPFVAYRINKDKAPTPIRPTPGRATWREYSGLFLKHNEENLLLRPRVIDQMAALSEEGIGPESRTRFMRCIGMRTDMKAKIFEWVDAGFDVPSEFLNDENAGPVIDRAISFAETCGNEISGVFKKAFKGNSKKSERFSHLRTNMIEAYWESLAQPFGKFITQLGANPISDHAQEDILSNAWLNPVVDHARRIFRAAAADTGDDPEAMRKRIEGEHWCNYRLTIVLEKEQKTQ